LRNSHEVDLHAVRGLGLETAKKKPLSARAKLRAAWKTRNPLIIRQLQSTNKNLVRRGDSRAGYSGELLAANSTVR
jgi:hypothetical protein